MNSADSWFSQTFEFGGFADVFQNSFMTRRNVRLLFRQAARRVAAVAIRATKDHVRCLVHWFHAVVALNAPGTFRVGGGLRLIDEVLARTGRRLGN